MIAAVVPVKALARSKSRLADGDEAIASRLADGDEAIASRLADGGRDAIEALALAMLGDVLEALLRVPELGRVAVVTPDAEVARVARAVGAEALLRDDPGLDASIDAAGAVLAPGPSDALLVVLGDVAAAAPQEISQLVRSLDGPGVALAPSRDGGTSALLRRPRDVIPSRFGPDSAKRHRQAAERAGVAYHECLLPSLAIDVDVLEDARAILASPTLGARTRAALAPLSHDGGAP